MNKSLAAACEPSFPADVRLRGRQYFEEGRVDLEYCRREDALAYVSGNSADYSVLVDWNAASAGALHVDCDCPFYADWGYCKHLWATLLALDAAGCGPTSVPSTLVLQPAEDQADEEDDDDEYVEDDEDDDEDDPLDEAPDASRPLPGESAQDFLNRMKAQFPRLRAGPEQLGKPGKVPHWRKQLDALVQYQRAVEQEHALVPALVDKYCEAWYVLDVEATRATSLLAIEFFRREKLKSGTFGKLKPASVARSDLSRFSLPEDRQMLQFLLATNADEDSSYGGHAYGYRHYGYEPKSSGVALPIPQCDTWLPQLCATGRFVWVAGGYPSPEPNTERILTWDDGPAWQFRIRVEADDQQHCWRFGGELQREGVPDPVDLTNASLLTPGVLLLDDRLARLDAGDSFAWIVELRKGPILEVPYSDRWDLLRHLWQLPGAATARLPENLRCTEVRVPPQGHLVVHSPKQQQYATDRLHGDVSFLYGEQSVRASDPGSAIVDQAQERLVLRDRSQEQQMLLFLAKLGARPPERSYFGPPHDLSIPPAKFSAIVAGLVAAGWSVDAEGVRLRKAGEYRISVTSGVDWFDLEGSCNFDGQVVPLPKLLEALRKGEHFVRLGDGSRGLLPEEWLAQISGLAELGAAAGDHIRFQPSQALLLDALLAAQVVQEQVSVDEQFAHIRKQLRSFAGVSPQEQPPGFVGQLRNYQKGGLGWLGFLREFHLGGCLADDMGLGKTIQVLALLEAERTRENAIGPHTSLVVVPRSLVFNWIEEAARFTPQLRVLDYTGLLRKKALEGLAHYDLVVTTYGTLVRDITAIKNLRFRYAILDESQAIKNAQSQRAKACRLLQAEHRLAMTGTPVENHLGELWSLFEFLNPGMLGRSAAFAEFSRKTVQEQGDLKLLRRAVGPFLLRRTKEQVLTELPEKTEQTLYCDLEGSQREHYDELREYYRASLAARIDKSGLAKSKIHVLEALLRLRQAACHPGLLDKNRTAEPSAKLEALLEQLAEVIDEGHKALVFSQFTSFLALVRERLDKDQIVYEYLDGRTRNRQERVARFQTDAACPVFLISLKAGGQGLNLTAADYVFILDPWWNPAVEAQAVDRTHRIGQTRRVFAYRLIARDTVEDKIVELQKSKRDLAEAIVAADDNVIRNLTADDLQMLLS